MITKQFLKSKPVCKATFTLSEEAVPAAQSVALLGEFNNWDPANAVEMKKQKDGAYKAVVELETGKEFQFRYLVDGQNWVNGDADKYVQSPFGADNCVVITLN